MSKVRKIEFAGVPADIKIPKYWQERHKIKNEKINFLITIFILYHHIQKTDKSMTYRTFNFSYSLSI